MLFFLVHALIVPGEQITVNLIFPKKITESFSPNGKMKLTLGEVEMTVLIGLHRC
jgi:hypothetical protein